MTVKHVNMYIAVDCIFLQYIKPLEMGMKPQDTLAQTVCALSGTHWMVTFSIPEYNTIRCFPADQEDWFLHFS